MPPYLLYSAIGYAVLSLVAAIFVTRRLSKGKNALIGMLPALVFSMIAYTAFAVGAILYRFADGLILFCLAECAPIVSTAIYARLRVKRYQKLAEAYKEQRKAERPAIVTTMKMRRALQGFSVASSLSEEAQHEIVILLKNGTDPKVITSFYNCRESELVKISRAFEAHMAKNAPVPKAKGVDYTASAHQREFLLRLMMLAVQREWLFALKCEAVENHSLIGSTALIHLILNSLLCVNHNIAFPAQFIQELQRRQVPDTHLLIPVGLTLLSWDSAIECREAV